MNEMFRIEVPGGLPAGMFVGRQYAEGNRGRRMETVDPAAGKAFADFPAGDPSYYQVKCITARI